MGEANSDNVTPNQDAWRGDVTSDQIADEYPEYKYRDKGGLMKFLAWTGVALIVIPSALAGIKSITKKEEKLT